MIMKTHLLVEITIGKPLFYCESKNSVLIKIFVLILVLNLNLIYF